MAETRETTVFETAIGLCGIAWGAAGILRTALPYRDAAHMYDWAARAGEASHRPPGEVEAAIGQIVHLLAGGAPDLRAIRLDLTGAGETELRIYERVRAILPGQTRMYGQVAADLGDPGLARAVGQAMGRNPCPIIIPCHRVLAAGGKPGGFSAPGGLATKRRMLAIEQVHAKREGDLFG